MRNKLILISVIFLIIINSCSDPITGDIGNIPPQSYMTLFPDSIISPGSTLRKISWWGDDPDGFVVGFRISFDSTKPIQEWDYTERTDSIFILQMNGNDTTFRFYVSAVDDDGAFDNTPASNLFPTVNSPPAMQFVNGTDVPDTIYPVATFQWNAVDPDGNSTINSFYWSLNDTNNFRKISGSLNIMTLNKDSGLVLNGNNCLYMKVQDNAGAFSNIVRMPEDSGEYFYVKKVNSKILLIKDMPIGEMAAASSYFINAMDTIRYDSLDIKIESGKFIPKIVNPMFIETLRLFDIVIWSAGRGNNTGDNANFDLAQRSIPFYLQTGGKVFFTCGFPNAETQNQGSLINFIQIDSIASCTIPFLSNVQLVNIDNSYPLLSTSSLVQRVRGIKVSSSVSVVYRLPANVACSDLTGGPVVAIKNTGLSPDVIFMCMPVYLLNGIPANSKLLMRKIIINEFGYN